MNKKYIIDEIENNDENKTREVHLKSEMYNHDNELIERREETNDAVMWGFVIGFALFFVVLIMIICFTH